MKNWFFVGMLVLAGCNVANRPKPTWAELIAFPTEDDRNAACDAGFQAAGSAWKSAGKIQIAATKGSIVFISTLGSVYEFCAYHGSNGFAKPKSSFTVSDVQVTDATLKLDQIKVSLVFEDSGGSELTAFSAVPAGSNSSVHMYSLNFPNATEEMRSKIRPAQKISFLIDRNGAKERYSFSSSEYSPTGAGLTR